MSLNLAEVEDLEDVFGGYIDNYILVDHRAQFELMTFKTSYASIETDGKFKTSIDADSKLLLISNLTNAEYIIYLDENDKVILYIYSRIPEIKLKEIKDGAHRLWNHLIELNKQQTDEEEEQKASTAKSDTSTAMISAEQLTHDEAIKKMLLYNEGLVDLNNMHCNVCDHNEFFDFVLCDDMKTIEAQCAHCYTIYRLIPSKYYVVHSRTIFVDNEKNKVNPELMRKQNGGSSND